MPFIDSKNKKIMIIAMVFLLSVSIDIYTFPYDLLYDDYT